LSHRNAAFDEKTANLVDDDSTLADKAGAGAVPRHPVKRRSMTNYLITVMQELVPAC
jgi:hypothetical protein